MRKRIKTITEVTHEHGVVSLDLPLYETLLDHASHESVTDKHIDMLIEKTIKITEEEDGEALTHAHLPALTEGQPETPALKEAASI
jgi:hypothetical protein